jgi:hypothetical protein
MLHPKSAKEGREKGEGLPLAPNYQNLALCVAAGNGVNVGVGI